MSVDPLIKYHESPYAYAANNPIMFIDPNGMDTVEIDNALNTAVAGDVIDWGDGEYSNMQNLPEFQATVDPVQQLYNRVNSLRESPEFKTRQRIGIYGGTIMSEGNGVTYEQVTSNTLVKYGPNVDYPEYKFIYPHDQGTWDTPGSDGLYWKGCMSCHSSLGAYNYASYNSRERLAGTVAAAALTEFVGGMLMNIPAAKGVVQPELKMGQQEVWKKFGEHYKEFGLTHSKEGMEQYSKIAQEVFQNPEINHTFPQGGHYAGETWLINNGRLLRLTPQGNFRSLYMLK